MSVTFDPEENEIRALKNLGVDFTGKHVLEIGSGKGRLTWRYAEQAGHVTALEPNEERAAVARAEMPPSLQGRVEILTTSIENFEPMREASGYDMAILSWVL